MTDTTTIPGEAPTAAPAANPEAAPTPAPGTETSEPAAAPAATLVNTDPNPVQAVPTAINWGAVQLPEGVQLAPEAMTQLNDVLQNPESTVEQRAQALIEMNQSDLAAQRESMETENESVWETTQTEWRDAVQNDPEIGGAKLTESLANVAALLEQHTDIPGLREAFDVTGAGNHPAVVKMLARLGAQFKEGGQVSGSPPTASLSQADKMFGNTG